jgi:DNA polymerase-3 subunit delta'
MIKVEQIRDLQSQLALAPFESEWRVALFQRFHEANDSAANALLKTLEEPAPRVVLILTARSSESLLPTIVSRCEVLPLRQVPDELIARSLSGMDLTAEEAELITRLADGRPGLAIAKGSDPENLARRSQWLDDLVELIPDTIAGRFAYIEAMLDGQDPESQRELALEALEQWASLWRDAMLTSYRTEGVKPRNIDRAADLEQIVQRIDIELIGDSLRQAEGVRKAIQQNANVRLALETWFLDLPQI